MLYNILSLDRQSFSITTTLENFTIDRKLLIALKKTMLYAIDCRQQKNLAFSGRLCANDKIWKSFLL